MFNAPTPMNYILNNDMMRHFNSTPTTNDKLNHQKYDDFN